MIEKVNPMHPDKIADRIAGALVDYAYMQEDEPKCAFEVLIGHGRCLIIGETSVKIPKDFITNTVKRISKCDNVAVNYVEVDQDKHLADNQSKRLKCGDNGIFKGKPLTEEEKTLSLLARRLYDKFPNDGKFILDDGKLIICQSNALIHDITEVIRTIPWLHKTRNLIINPLGEWTGGINVDSGATNRKLGSDMGHSVTGGGLHGKDLSKADVSINILAHISAQATGEDIDICCAIGDDFVVNSSGGFDHYEDIVKKAREYVKEIGGFEKLAEWGLV